MQMENEDTVIPLSYSGFCQTEKLAFSIKNLQKLIQLVTSGHNLFVDFVQVQPHP